MSAELYWRSKTIVIDWPLVDLAGDPITDATVTGTAYLPDGSIEPMGVAIIGDVYRATYDPIASGWHAFRLLGTGTGDSAEQVRVYVKPDLFGSLPPNLDPTTDVGLVRLLIADVNEDALLFTDEQIQAFLSLEAGAVKVAAAAALDAIARSEALVSKVIRTQDLQTDGAKLAAELRASAAELRRQVREDDVTPGDSDAGLDIVDFDPWAAERAFISEF